VDSVAEAHGAGIGNFSGTVTAPGSAAGVVGSATLAAFLSASTECGAAVASDDRAVAAGFSGAFGAELFSGSGRSGPDACFSGWAAAGFR
jgi:hypothetical protein